MNETENEPLLIRSQTSSHETDVTNDVERLRINSSPTPTKLTNFLLWSVLAVNLGAISAGLVLGYSSPAIPSIIKDPSIPFTEFYKSLFGSIPCFTAAFGGFIGSTISSKYGRKPTILFTSLPYTLGWLLITWSSKNVNLMILGRGFGGLAMGMTFVSVPNYVSEISPNNYRGFLATFLQISVNVGILLAYFLGRYLEYENLSLAALVPTVVMVICLQNIPDSPRFLVSKHRKQEARLALMKFRDNDTNLVNQELTRIDESNAINSTEAHESTGVKLLFAEPKLRKAFLLASSAIYLQQLSGINLVVFYTEDIYKQAGIQDTNLASIYVALANIFMTIVSSKLVDKAGRKLLLSVSSFGMSFFLMIFSFYFYNIDGLDINEISKIYKIIGVACPVCYIMAFAIGFGPIPWMYAGEILPGKIKDEACAISNFLGWMASFMVTFGFQGILLPTFNTFGSFMIFAVICLFCSVYFKIYLVETKNKSLEEIELLLE